MESEVWPKCGLKVTYQIGNNILYLTILNFSLRTIIHIIQQVYIKGLFSDQFYF